MPKFNYDYVKMHQRFFQAIPSVINDLQTMLKPINDYAKNCQPKIIIIQPLMTLGMIILRFINDLFHYLSRPNLT